MQNLRTAVVGLVVAVAVVAGSVAPVAGTASVAASSGDLTVHTSEETTSVAAGETTTVTIVASNVTAGVGAYNLSVDLSNASVARIEDFSLAGGPDGTDVATDADNSSLRVTAYGVDTPQTGTVEIAQVTLAGESAGESSVGVDVAVIGDENGTEYAPVSTSAGDLSVTAETTTETTTATTTAANETTSSSGGGDAGGGGGGGANVPAAPIQFSEEQVEDGVRLDVRAVRPDKPLATDVEGVAAGGMTVERVRLGFAEEDPHILFEFTAASESPGGVAEPPGEAVIGHVAVDTEYASASVVDSASYRFRLPASALPTGATLDDVAVYRYADESWTEVGVERDGATFSATTDELSPFAVVIDPSADGSGPSTAAETTAGDSTATPAEESAGTATADADADGGVPGFGFGVALAALVAAGLLARPREN